MSIFFENQISGETPKAFGWYHLSWVAITVVASVLFSMKFAKKQDEKTDDRVIFALGAMLILIEIYKQFFRYRVDGGYDWRHFPLQLCSVPMYTATLGAVLKSGKIKDALYKFTAFIGGTSGVGVMLFPNSCLSTPYIAMLIHTMLWHATLIIMSVYIISAKGYCKNLLNFKRELLSAVAVFTVISIIVAITDIIAYKLFFGTSLNVNGYSFNMFYISPYYGAPFDFIVSLKDAVPYIVFFIGYIAVVSSGSVTLWTAGYLIGKIKKEKNG